MDLSMPGVPTVSGCNPHGESMKTRHPNDTRERVVTVMLSDVEKERMTARARKKGLRLAPWLRMLGLNELSKEDD
jgi:hypothetical protein